MVDRMFAFIFDDMWQFAFLLLALFVVISIIVPEMIPILIGAVGCYSFAALTVDRSNREAKRETNNALAPILTTVNETVAARPLIHTMKLGDFFCKRNYDNIDRWNR